MKIILNTPLSPALLAQMCGGTLHAFGQEMPAVISGICTDSREADTETLFCAIKGERVDGHKFLPAVLRAGCPACLCERLPDEGEDLSDCRAVAILVKDTVAALSALAAYRREHDLAAMQTVAVTGSVGKTTTKEMIASVFASACRHEGAYFKKDGNYNSTIGLPLSMMEIPSETTHAVLEMGMSGRGEIAAMTAAARPNIAVITNIGSSHMERLGSREAIAEAKLEIREGLCEGGTLLLCGDEPLLLAVGGRECPVPPSIRVLRLTLQDAPHAAFAACRIRAAETGMTFDLRTPKGEMRDLFVAAVGEHMVWAGAYAAAVGVLSGLSEASIREGLATYRPASLRQSRRQVGKMTFIEDCYNAAPESMRAAFGVLDITAATPASRKIAVLGSMMELGEESAAIHRGVGRELASRHPDLLVTIGDLGAQIAEGAREGGLAAERILVLGADLTPDTPAVTASYDAYAAEIASRLLAGDILLFKASRAMALESLSAALAAKLENALSE